MKDSKDNSDKLRQGYLLSYAHICNVCNVEYESTEEEPFCLMCSTLEEIVTKVRNKNVV